MTSEQRSLPRPLIEAIAGFTAGLLATVTVHPLDVIKTRLQIDRHSTAQFGSTARIIREILHSDGRNIRAFYRGLSTNIVGNTSSWAVYFLLYGEMKELVAEWRNGEQLGSADFLLTSLSAGVLTQAVTNPLWVLKTRVLSTGRNAEGAYKGMVDGFMHIMKEDGWRGYYRGMVPGLFGVAHGAVHFMAYEKFKIWVMDRKRAQGGDGTLSTVDVVLTSGGSKIFAGAVTYPYQVLRARLQAYDADKNYRGVIDAVQKTWRSEGLKGFYKGLTPNLVRVLPSTCITLLVYENTRKYLLNQP